MRLLLDECVPKRLGRHLPAHEVRTVPEMGWSAYENGRLLGLAESAFDIFVTTDQNLQYQQSVAGRDIAVIILVARRNKLEFFLPLLDALEQAVSETKPGDLCEVGNA